MLAARPWSHRGIGGAGSTGNDPVRRGPGPRSTPPREDSPARSTTATQTRPKPGGPGKNDKAAPSTPAAAQAREGQTGLTRGSTKQKLKQDEAGKAKPTSTKDRSTKPDQPAKDSPKPATTQRVHEGKTFTATEDPKSGEVDLERTTEQPATETTPASTDVHRVKLRPDGTRTERLESTGPPPADPAQPRPTTALVTEHDAAGEVTAMRTEDSFTVEVPSEHGPVTETHVETTLLDPADGTTVLGRSTSIRQEGTDASGAEVDHEVVERFDAEGRTTEHEVSTTRTDEDGGNSSTSTTTTFDADGRPATTLIERGGDQLDGSAGAPPAREYVAWKDGEPAHRLASSEELDASDFDAAVAKLTKGGDSGDLPDSIRELDTSGIGAGHEAAQVFRRNDDNEWDADAIDGELVPPYEPSRSVSTELTVPPQIAADASDAAITASAPTVGTPEFDALAARQAAFEQSLPALDEQQRTVAMQQYFTEQRYWVEQPPPAAEGEPPAQPTVLAARWVDAGEAAAAGDRPHVALARTGIASEADGYPATLDLNARWYADLTRADEVRSTAQTEHGGSVTTTMNEQSNAAGVVVDRVTEVDSTQMRPMEALGPLHTRQVVHEQFTDAGVPATSFTATTTTDDLAVTLTERVDTFGADGLLDDTRISETRTSRDWASVDSDGDGTPDTSVADQYVEAMDEFVDDLRGGAEFNIDDDHVELPFPATGSSHVVTKTDIDYDDAGTAIYMEVDEQAQQVLPTIETDEKNQPTGEFGRGGTLAVSDKTTTFGTRGGTVPILGADGRPVVDGSVSNTVKSYEFDPDGGFEEGHQYRRITETTMTAKLAPDGTTSQAEFSPMREFLLSEGNDDDYYFEEQLLETDATGQPLRTDSDELVLVEEGDEWTDPITGEVHEWGGGFRREDFDPADKFTDFMDQHWSKITLVGGAMLAIAGTVALPFSGGLSAGLIVGGIALAATDAAWTGYKVHQGEADWGDLGMSLAGVGLAALPGVGQWAKTASTAGRVAAAGAGAADDLARGASLVSRAAGAGRNGALAFGNAMNSSKVLSHTLNFTDIGLGLPATYQGLQDGVDPWDALGLFTLGMGLGGSAAAGKALGATGIADGYRARHGLPPLGNAARSNPAPQATEPTATGADGAPEVVRHDTNADASPFELPGTSTRPGTWPDLDAGLDTGPDGTHVPIEANNSGRRQIGLTDRLVQREDGSWSLASPDLFGVTPIPDRMVTREGSTDTYESLLAELGPRVKNPDNIVRIGRDGNGQVVWLESGGANRNSGRAAGLDHIAVEHGAEFAAAGIPADELPDFLMRARLEGDVIGSAKKNDAGRPIYELEYNDRTYRVAITDGDGFIVGANLYGAQRKIHPLPVVEGSARGDAARDATPGERDSRRRTVRVNGQDLEYVGHTRDGQVEVVLPNGSLAHVADPNGRVPREPLPIDVPDTAAAEAAARGEADGISAPVRVTGDDAVQAEVRRAIGDPNRVLERRMLPQDGYVFRVDDAIVVVDAAGDPDPARIGQAAIDARDQMRRIEALAPGALRGEVITYANYSAGRYMRGEATGQTNQVVLYANNITDSYGRSVQLHEHFHGLFGTGGMNRTRAVVGDQGVLRQVVDGDTWETAAQADRQYGRTHPLRDARVVSAHPRIADLSLANGEPVLLGDIIGGERYGTTDYANDFNNDTRASNRDPRNGDHVSERSRRDSEDFAEWGALYVESMDQPLVVVELPDGTRRNLYAADLQPNRTRQIEHALATAPTATANRPIVDGGATRTYAGPYGSDAAARYYVEGFLPGFARINGLPAMRASRVNTPDDYLARAQMYHDMASSEAVPAGIERTVTANGSIELYNTITTEFARINANGTMGVLRIGRPNAA